MIEVYTEFLFNLAGALAMTVLMVPLVFACGSIIYVIYDCFKEFITIERLKRK